MAIYQNNWRTELSLVLMLFVFRTTAQEQIVFKSGDKICFVGNSITNNGEFYYFINLFYATRYPNEKLTFFNCGISGNTAADVLKRLDDDVLQRRPDWSVLMLGMNDVNRRLYSKSLNDSAGIRQKRQEAIDRYKIDMEKIVLKLLKSNSKIIIEKPTIYDQTGMLGAENRFGVNDALRKCSDYIDTLAGKYSLPVIDYWTILKNINRKIQKEDPTKTIIGPDRVHPQSPGHFIMAYEFIHETIHPGVVSLININARSSRVHCDNCALDSLSVGNGRIVFSCLEKSIPFPIKDEARPALPFVPFIKEYDQEILKVSKLNRGNYRLLVDSRNIGEYTDTDLKNGVNLALVKNMPQYEQASGVLDLLTQYRAAEGNIRALRFVEYDFIENIQTSNSDSIRAYLSKLLESKYSGSEYRDYYKSQFDHYMEFKPKETELKRSMESILANIYEYNKPQSHSFELVKYSKAAAQN